MYMNVSVLQHGKTPIVVRYIPSIDRRNTVEHASQTLDLISELMKSTNLIAGIDLSGHGQVSVDKKLLPRSLL